MIVIDNTSLSYAGMGLFTTDGDWIHPQIRETTYEIIYVIEGTVHLEEEGYPVTLESGDLVLLRPGKLHGGNHPSRGRTSFYWTHFRTDRLPQDEHPLVVRNFATPSLFKELLHYSYLPSGNQAVKDSILAHLLCILVKEKEESELSSLGCNVFEWTRINIRNGLTVQEVAARFGYNGEYLSRLMKKQYGRSLKVLIDDFLVQKAKDYLSTSTYSVKEIATLLNFSSANGFVNFFKYHEKISPQIYRNRYSHTHMNNH